MHMCNAYIWDIIRNKGTIGLFEKRNHPKEIKVKTRCFKREVKIMLSSKIKKFTLSSYVWNWFEFYIEFVTFLFHIYLYASYNHYESQTCTLEKTKSQT